MITNIVKHFVIQMQYLHYKRVISQPEHNWRSPKFEEEFCGVVGAVSSFRIALS
jgi:hypothetical protein